MKTVFVVLMRDRETTEMKRDFGMDNLRKTVWIPIIIH